jgi:hypothetical protein
MFCGLFLVLRIMFFLSKGVAVDFICGSFEDWVFFL